MFLFDTFQLRFVRSSKSNISICKKKQAVRFVSNRALRFVKNEAKFMRHPVLFSAEFAWLEKMASRKKRSMSRSRIDSIFDVEENSKKKPKSRKTLTDDTFNVERIVSHRVTKHSVEYLVKWQNYDDDENTWEGEKHLLECGCEFTIQAYFQQCLKGPPKVRQKYAKGTT